MTETFDEILPDALQRGILSQDTTSPTFYGHFSYLGRDESGVPLFRHRETKCHLSADGKSFFRLVFNDDIEETLSDPDDDGDDDVEVIHLTIAEHELFLERLLRIRAANDEIQDLAAAAGGVDAVLRALDAMQRQAKAASTLLEPRSRSSREPLKEAQRDMAADPRGCRVVLKISDVLRKSIPALSPDDIRELILD